MENLLALPIGVVAAVTVAALWFLVTPLRDITPAMSLPTFLLLFAGLVFVHELIHALIHPMAGLSPHCYELCQHGKALGTSFFL
jgi:hypothetical protein